MVTDERIPLKSLFWEATLRCNARCEFCGSRCGDKELQTAADEIGYDEICACFKEISGHYDPGRIMINVTGGEPLIRRDLFDVMSYAHELGFCWGMVTNGFLITPEVVERMQAAGMSTISISLDGLPQTHDRLRRLDKGFERIEKAVSLLREADFLDEIQITTVVNHENISELEELFGHIRDMKVDSWRLAIVDPIGRAADNRRLLLTKEDLERYFEFFRLHQFNGDVTLTTSCSHFLGTNDNLYRSHSFTCQTGKTVASILANGDIYVCPNVPRIPELIQGNIRTDSFCDVWENGFEWFRSDARIKDKECSNCEYSERCKGDSLHTWDFESESPRFCWMTIYPEDVLYGDRHDGLLEKLTDAYGHVKGTRVSYQSSSHCKVFFTPDAWDELRILFAWGSNHPRNRYELMAGLAGHFADDTFLIEVVIPGRLERRSTTEAALSETCYRELLAELDIANECMKYAEGRFRIFPQKYELLGIAHTHPNDLNAVMSVPDMKMHEAMLKVHPHFLTVIVNPQKRDICAYYDSVYSPVDVELLRLNG